MRWAPIVMAVVLASGCDSGPSEPSENDSPNVNVSVGAELVTSDTGVLVNGARRINFGNAPRGIFVNHFTEFTYGGLYERINDELVGESWYMDVGRRIVTDVRGDTVFSRALDFGDVALEGTPALRHEVDTALVIDTGSEVRVYENYLNIRVIIYSHRLNMDGSTVTFVHEPFYEHMVAGGAIELTASGSDDIASTSASLTLDPGAKVTALWNGEDVDFERQLPVLRTDQPLVVELSEPLHPDRTVIHLAYAQPPPHDLDPDEVRRASAVFQLMERTNRVVIPASALAEIASHLPVVEGGFVFRIYEYTVMEDVLQIVRLEDGITETLSALQSNGSGFYVRMSR